MGDFHLLTNRLVMQKKIRKTICNYLFAHLKSKLIGSLQFYVRRSKESQVASLINENPPFLTASSSVATKYFDANGLEAFSYQVIAASFASYLLTNEIR